MTEPGATVAQTINDILVDALAPVHLEILNESNKHNVPANSETHFKVVVVSEAFAQQSLVQRHRAVNKLLARSRNGWTKVSWFLNRLRVEVVASVRPQYR